MSKGGTGWLDRDGGLGNMLGEGRSGVACRQGWDHCTAHLWQDLLKRSFPHTTAGSDSAQDFPRNHTSSAQEGIPGPVVHTACSRCEERNEL